MNPISIFRALNKAGVKYCLIGRMAAAMFGLNVHTDDVDILLFRSIPNARKFFKALLSLKAVDHVPPAAELDLFLSSKVTRFNVGDYILDVLKWQEGFPKIAWTRVRTFRVRGVQVRVAELHDLIQTKSQTPRRKDKADVRALEKLLRRKKPRS